MTTSGSRLDHRIRLLDLTLVLVSAPAVLPIVKIIAVAIRLDSPGPIVFTQKRTGRHGRRFRMFWNAVRGDMSIVGPRPTSTSALGSTRTASGTVRSVTTSGSSS